VKNWNKCILNKNNSMHDAIDLLNDRSSRIILVIDKSEKLVGTITDGDIRRALLRKHILDSKLEDFMNPKPIVGLIGESKESLTGKFTKYDLLHIPIIDEENHVVGLESYQDMFSKAYHKNPVFIMAGGFGKRLRPLTDDLPKPMLRIGEKPILHHILDQFIKSGFHDFYISTHYKANLVRDYFQDGSKWGVSINYVHEEKPLGTAGALGLLKSNEFKLPIFVMNGDLFTEVDLGKFMEFHLKSSSSATIGVRTIDFKVPYGVVRGNDSIITRIEEKPVQKFFVNAGMYILNPELIYKVCGTVHLDMPDFLNSLVDDLYKINMFPIHEYWMDVGHIENYNSLRNKLVNK
jgi:dTDP-glucose pyrophosphorylase